MPMTDTRSSFVASLRNRRAAILSRLPHASAADRYKLLASAERLQREIDRELRWFGPVKEKDGSQGARKRRQKPRR